MTEPAPPTSADRSSWSEAFLLARLPSVKPLAVQRYLNPQDWAGGGAWAARFLSFASPVSQVVVFRGRGPVIAVSTGYLASEPDLFPERLARLRDRARAAPRLLAVRVTLLWMIWDRWPRPPGVGDWPAGGRSALSAAGGLALYPVWRLLGARSGLRDPWELLGGGSG